MSSQQTQNRTQSKGRGAQNQAHGHQPSRQRGRGDQKLKDRFPADIDYFPEVTLKEEELVTIEAVVTHLAATEHEGGVAAITFTDWLALHDGKPSGHAMRRRTDLLRKIQWNPAASNSARQYRTRSSRMDNPEAAATARLVMAEDQILRYYAGHEINLGQLEETLGFIAQIFHGLPGCSKLEGGTLSMLALVQLRRSINFRDGTINEVGHEHSVRTMVAAVKLIGPAYGIQSVADLVQALDGISTPSAQETGAGAHRQPAHA
jgi:hypothetical protein